MPEPPNDSSPVSPPAASPTGQNVPNLTSKQYIWFNIAIALISSGVISTLITKLTAGSSVHSSITSPATQTDIRQQVQDAVATNLATYKPVVGEIRAFAFGGQKDDSTIERLRSLGWLECAGQLIPRTGFEDLYDILDKNQTWGKVGNQIRIPDLRGVFLRGCTHGATEANNTDGDITTRQIPPGSSRRNTPSDQNTVGTYEPDAFKIHTHNENAGSSNNGGSLSGVVGASMNGVTRSDVPTDPPNVGAGNETHPKNVYVMYCIYVGDHAKVDSIAYGDTPNTQ